jgi:acyl transferase domain-containing protein/acyl carrier protein
MSESAAIDESFDVAITGMACRLPGAPSIEAFWQVLQSGTECIRSFSDAELLALGVPPATLSAEGFVKAGAVLDGIDQFDAAFFGYSAREAELMDPQHRIFLECAWEALERAGCAPDPRRTAGVFAGAGLSTYLLFNLLTRPELVDAIDRFQTMVGNDKDFLATRLSYQLDLRGPSFTVQTGCSTSLVAIHLACQSLLGYHCDVAIAGGAAVQVPQRTGYHYQPGGIASPDGHCRPFDASAAGTIFGSGVGVVVLKRLADALADDDHIHAVIKGSAINNDGSTKLGYTAPSVEGQVEVITRAHAMAQVSPDSIGFVETHGTGTALGDPVEVEALARVFGAVPVAPRVCALGSVKSNVGHLDAAAGVTGLIKAALAIEHGEVPPTLHIQRPNPIIAWDDSPFFVNAARTPWRVGGHRRAGVSSFGIGGTNAHVVLEEPPPRPASGPSRPHSLLVLSARTLTALDRSTAALARHIEQRPEQPIADVAYSLQVGRGALPYRRAVVCRDATDAVEALTALPPQRSATPPGKAESRRVVFMFAGGGAQHTRMGQELYQREPVFREHFDACAERLAPRLGVHLRDVVYPAVGEASERLTRTSIALPALFAVEYALARLWLSWGVEPDAMIGHSAGEYVAACLAGVFSLDDALALIAERGRLFEIAPRGSMLNVELPEPELRALVGDRLSIAAVNGPAQCVVAGDLQAIEGFAAELAARGIEARRVHIDVAAHSHLIEPIMPAFARLLSTLELRAPERPFLSCVTGAWITPGEATTVEYWLRHLRQTVQFGAGVRSLLDSARPVFLEVGPGRTLSSLVRQQLPADSDALVFTSMRSPLEDRPDTEVLMTTLGRLWAAGAQVDFARVSAHEQRLRVILPTYPWERRRFWLDPHPADGIARQAPRPERGERSDLAGWFYLPSWRHALPPAPVAAPVSWLVFTEPGPDAVGARLAAHLLATGHEVATVAPGAGLRQVGIGAYEIDPREEDACAALLAELVRARRRPDRIVYLWGSLPPPSGEDPIDHARLFGLDVLISLGQALGTALAGHPVHLAVVTSGVELVSGRETLRPERALALGPCRVLPIELAHVTCALIDLEDGPVAGPDLSRLAAEVAGPAACAVVALRGMRRFVQAFDPVRIEAPAARPEPVFRSRGVYLITGGLGGIGLVLAEHLARHAQARLALLSRSELPERAVWPAWRASHPDDDPTVMRIRQIEALEALGAEVLLLGADVADEDQVERAVQRIRARFGALHGVIHAAGIPSGGLIQVKARASIGSVLRPKVQGTLVLDRVLRRVLGRVPGEPLDFFVVCSSRTATTGDVGQVDHAAANAFLEAFAERRAQHGGDGPGVVALAWDTWAEVGQAVTTAIPGGIPSGIEALRTQLLVHAIRPAEGPQVLERVLACGAPRVVISTRPIEVAAADSLRLGRELLAMAGLAGDDPGPPAPLAAGATGPELERAIARIWGRVLRVDHIGPDDSFFDLGGNSVIALRLISELKRELGLVLPVAALFESPTVASLAQRLAGDGGAAEDIEDRKSRGARRRARHHRRQDSK